MTATQRILGLVILAWAAATLGGCATSYKESPNSLGGAVTPRDGARPGRPGLADPLRGPTTAPTDAATTRPQVPALTADIRRAELLITRLDFTAARTLLVDLEGRMLLARDLDRAAWAAFWMAFCDEKMDLLDAAAEEYSRLIDRYPDSPQARTAGDRLNRFRPTLLPARAVPVQ